MKINFSKYAKMELDDASNFHELEFAGLGLQFKEEVKKALIRISEYPNAWSVECGDVRKYLLHKFPINCCIQLKKITYSLLLSHISITSLIIGLIENRFDVIKE
jgi:hypothetical protein